MKEYSQELDSTDKAILRQLQQDSAISNVELARRVNLSPPAVHARIKRLEELKYIRGYVALLDREKVGYDMLCLVTVTLQQHRPEQTDAFREKIKDMTEVLECFYGTGDYDYLLKVAVRNRKHLEHFLMEKLTHISGVARITTSIVLGEIKNTTALDLDLENI
jgi:Lrp/AsnC family transcriptional regulator, leucine-responsive regulatory protein